MVVLMAESSDCSELRATRGCRETWNCFLEWPQNEKEQIRMQEQSEGGLEWFFLVQRLRFLAGGWELKHSFTLNSIPAKLYVWTCIQKGKFPVLDCMVLQGKVHVFIPRSQLKSSTHWVPSKFLLMNKWSDPLLSFLPFRSPPSCPFLHILCSRLRACAYDEVCITSSSQQEYSLEERFLLKNGYRGLASTDEMSRLKAFWGVLCGVCFVLFFWR